MNHRRCELPTLLAEQTEVERKHSSSTWLCVTSVIHKNQLVSLEDLALEIEIHGSMRIYPKPTG